MWGVCMWFGHSNWSHITAFKMRQMRQRMKKIQVEVILRAFLWGFAFSFSTSTVQKHAWLVLLETLNYPLMCSHPCLHPTSDWMNVKTHCSRSLHSSMVQSPPPPLVRIINGYITVQPPDRVQSHYSDHHISSAPAASSSSPPLLLFLCTLLAVQTWTALL